MNRSARPTAVIADDEPRLLDDLARRLARLWPELEIVARSANGSGALDALQRLRPQFAFLDIRMPKPDGLDIAKALLDAGQECTVVFVTAHDEHAVRAFEHCAADYVLKPVSDERLQATVSRLQQRWSSATPSSAALLEPLLQALAHRETPQWTSPLRWLKASTRSAQGEEIHLLDISSVLAFEAADKYLRVITAQGEFLVRMALKELVEKLDANEFWQIHRGTVIRVSAIERTVRSLSGKLTVHLRGSPERFEVSRSFHSLFKSD
jgi:DNA-binding LytR/AlgR family response regulator